MKKTDFFYELPSELIAQTPMEPRDHSRMLVLNRQTGQLQHKHFYDIIDYLEEGDALILNDSRVLPARIYGIKDQTDVPVEFLLLESKGLNTWEVMVRPGRRLKPGASVTFGGGLLKANILQVLEGGNRLVEFFCEENLFAVLEKIGQMPLPPYITQKLEDKERYQTVYSKELGSAAAPTAGLHFTPELLQKIQAKGVRLGYVTLHVGLGTFRPVKVDEITEHKMHSEHYSMPKETADLINQTRKNGKRVIAVGTTSCRTLESVPLVDAKVQPCEGYTNIFIYPGYQFNLLNGLVTNFHLPESTLIMLVSAFAGYHTTMQAYKTAVEERYRFFSFGDAMLVV